MRALNRRRFLVVVGGSVAGAGIGARASAAPTQTLWVLDPDWGYPLTTATGSDTKMRCHGRACHLAAPHRFFLTEADALAGRLHACCLAQPVPVSVCIDLNALMPYYRARLGGVDARCPELPSTLRDALYASSSCPAAPPPVQPPAPPDPQPPTPAPQPPPPAPAGPSVPPSEEDPDPDPAGPGPTETPSTLPATGVSTAATVMAAAILTTTGMAALATRNARTTEPAPPDGA